MEAQVLIVGAGPVGLTTALELTRHGIPVRIIDRKAAPSAHSKALGVMPRTLELLEKTGVAGKMLAAGNGLQALNIYDNRQRVVRIPTDALDSSFPILVLAQSVTEHILIDALNEKGVPVDWETELTDLRRENEAVWVNLQQASGREETATYPWLIACDGVRSTVRHSLNIDFDLTKEPETYLLADLEVHWNLPYGETYAFLSPESDMAVFPFPDAPLCRLVIPAFDSPGEINLDVIRREFRRRCTLEARLQNPQWISTFKVSRAIIDQYRHGCVFFAGDAAHVHSPQGGQGMNTGIQDAFNLAWKLALVWKGAARPELLDTYQLERHPVAERVLRTTAGTTRITLFRNPWLRKIRNLAITQVAPVFSRTLLRSMANVSLSYGKNAYVSETVSGPGRLIPLSSPPRAGERAPDVTWVNPAGETQRLFEMLKSPNLVLLYFTEQEPAAEMDAISRLFPHLDPYVIRRNSAEEKPRTYRILTDPGGEIAAAYKLQQEAMYIIRPDGYVAWYSQPASITKTMAYLQRFFR